MDNNKKTWKQAIKLIPNGNLFLSKNPSRFLKNHWPTYFSKSKGCEVWDLNNKKYYDLSLMGVGTNILGYANNKVDKEVKKVIKKGNLTTLNCPEDVQLAKKLVSLHPWANMARFAKTGGEANSIAIRIARSFTKKEIIIICGYHGWHDWYLAANLEHKNRLDTHLFKDLKFNGVPKKLKGTVKTFDYNDIKKFKYLLNKYRGKIAAVKMEVEREQKPNKNFLSEIRNLTKRNKILLIFDECTSGFRENLGGLHLKYNVHPDLALYGKALGNGYPITAILGKKNIMKASNNTFISSTFWTDRIGKVAALATLKEMQRIKSWKLINIIGRRLKIKIKKICEKNSFTVRFKGLDTLITFEIESKNKKIIYEYLTYRMLQNGFLAKNTIYISVSHKKKIIDKYLKTLDLVLKEIKILKVSDIRKKIS